jgi:hypothetical protein
MVTMSNWIIEERVVIRCPECRNVADMMTQACPSCGAIMGEKPEGEYAKYRARFGMNGGARSEDYDVLLTEEEYDYALTLSDSELYNYIVCDMEDRIVDVDIDAGTEYDGMCGEIEFLEVCEA